MIILWWLKKGDFRYTTGPAQRVQFVVRFFVCFIRINMRMQSVYNNKKCECFINSSSNKCMKSAHSLNPTQTAYFYNIMASRMD
jgi:hypothetical protein